MLPKKLRNAMFQRVSERTLRNRHAEGTDPLLAEVLAQIDAEFVPGGPITVHTPIPELMAAIWSVGREVLLVEGDVGRADKEALAATVAVSNTCPYCADMHVSMAHAGGEHAVAEAIRKNRLEALPPSPLRARLLWARATRQADSAVVRNPPFTAAEAPEIVGTAVYFHYINRVVNALFDDTALPGGPLKGTLLRLFGSELRGNVASKPVAGTSIALLPAAPDVPTPPWLRGAPILAAAWRRWAATIERHAGPAATPAVRALVDDALAGWDGSDPGFGPVRFEDRVDELPADERPAARLALLVALASYRVTDAELDALAAVHPGDAARLGLVAWAAYAAAMRIGTWLALPDQPAATTSASASIPSIGGPANVVSGTTSRLTPSSR